MLDKFWETLGGDLAKRWLEHLFGPAFLFWAGGAGLYLWRSGWRETLEQVQRWTAFEQAAALVGALLVLFISSLAAREWRLPLLRLLEGYFPPPFDRLGRIIVQRNRRQLAQNWNRLRALLDKRKEAQQQGSKLPAVEQRELERLEMWCYRHPPSENDLLPLPLGNTLRAREVAPRYKYGLDVLACWPRLWFLLPEYEREQLSQARAALDRRVELWFWGWQFLLWTLLTPWALLIAALWLIAAYDMAVQSASTYGDLLESAFDLHRFRLYDALHWQRPANSEEEIQLGEQLSEFLWRGTTAAPLLYPPKS